MKVGIMDVFKKIRVILIPYLVLLVICLVLKLLFTREQIYFTVNGWHFSVGDVLAVYFTDMGDGLTIISLSILLLLFNYRVAFLLGTSYLATSIVAQVLKRIFSLPRPALYFKDQLSHIYFVKGVEVFEINSFPSGHTVSIFSAAVVLTYLTPKKAWGLLYLLIAVLVGYSRMYLSEHFFEDVVAGSVIGVFITVFWLSYIEAQPFIQRNSWKKGLINKYLGRVAQ